MSKFKIEHGASKVNLVLLKTNIEDTISQDIDALATWSNNDRKYIVKIVLVVPSGTLAVVRGA